MGMIEDLAVDAINSIAGEKIEVVVDQQLDRIVAKAIQEKITKEVDKRISVALDDAIKKVTSSLDRLDKINTFVDAAVTKSKNTIEKKCQTAIDKFETIDLKMSTKDEKDIKDLFSKRVSKILQLGLQRDLNGYNRHGPIYKTMVNSILPAVQKQIESMELVLPGTKEEPK